MSIKANAIPGVRCGSCLGRIDLGAIVLKRKIHAKLIASGHRPADEAFVPPSLCSECWLAALLELCKDETEKEVGT